MKLELRKTGKYELDSCRSVSYPVVALVCLLIDVFILWYWTQVIRKNDREW